MSQSKVHSYNVDARNNSEHLFSLGIVPCIPRPLSPCQQPSSLIMPFPKQFCYEWKYELNVEPQRRHRRTGHAGNKERNDSIVTECRSSFISLNYVGYYGCLVNCRRLLSENPRSSFENWARACISLNYFLPFTDFAFSNVRFEEKSP